MSDDFGTVSVKRGDRARELEVMRQRYRAHREALQRMVADAPTDHLATEYQRLIGDLDASLAKLDELEGRSGTVTPPPPPPPSRSTMSAGERPLATLPSLHCTCSTAIRVRATNGPVDVRHVLCVRLRCADELE